MAKGTVLMRAHLVITIASDFYGDDDSPKNVVYEFIGRHRTSCNEVRILKDNKEYCHINSFSNRIAKRNPV